MSNPKRTLDDVELPENEFWDLEYEAPTQVHWYRRGVSAEEVAANSERTAEEYRDTVSDEQMVYSMTLRCEDNEWFVDFTAPSVMKGMGDYDRRYSEKSVTLEEALDHVRRIFVKKGPAE